MLSRLWHTVDAPAMGSSMRVVLHGGSADLARALAAEVARLERLWSRFIASSDVVRCNQGAGRGPVAVAPETAAAVSLALELHAETEGRFDPTVLRALELNGYDETFEVVRARRDGALVSAPPGCAPMAIDLGSEPAPAPGCEGIEVDVAASTVSLRAGVSIDLGGIGKGLAADRVAELAMAGGALGVCASLGGDVRVAGAGPDDGAWTIPLDDPRRTASSLGSRSVRDGAIVMTTPLLRRWRQGGRWRHHLIDPATGRPADTALAAIVVELPTAARAEALAKAAFVAGPDAGAQLLAAAGAHAWLVAA